VKPVTRAAASRGSAGINYLLLLIVIVLGVVIGNLLSHWLGGMLGYRAGYDLDTLSRSAAAAATQARDGAVSQAQKAAGALASLQDQAREQRRRDREGLRLLAPCEEWRKAHAQLNTATTQTEMQRHCGLYERYVEHGVLPGKK
jgi:hypothetical protein